MLEVGVCETDRRILNGDIGAPPGYTDTLILGHELVGRVTETGDRVQGIKAGDVVVATVRRGCPFCESCRLGQADQCVTGFFTERGVQGSHGFLAEYVVEEEANLILLPRHLQQVAVLLEPLSTVLKSIDLIRTHGSTIARCGHQEHRWQKREWARCKRVLVCGDGILGVLAALVFKAKGSEVFLYAQGESIPLQASFAETADLACIAAQQCSPRELRDWVSGVDLVVETTGSPTVPPWVAPLVAPGGTLALVGYSLNDHRTVADSTPFLRTAVRSNLTILGCSAPHWRHLKEGVVELERLFRFFSQPLARLVTHRYPLPQFREAMCGGDPSRLKAAIRC
ncbi:MAG: alcohol dehydrogenase catalytic domain-containing protein [Chloroflexi bacterium]|nr:alcohol dehydrogenase catalytic domain-containing protein [Chloroflexota bacterium]